MNIPSLASILDMNSTAIRSLFLGAVLCASAFVARADDEDDLLAVLRSDAAIPAKAEACKRLRTIGTVRAVPALAELLTKDERLGHAARYALEGMPAAEALAALRTAAERSSGNLRVGLIDSLGWRRDDLAVPMLVSVLTDADRAVASAAASALGRIGGDTALSALQGARSKVGPEVGRAVREALLQCAERALAEGRSTDATGIYRSLYETDEEENIRQAAYAGLIRATGDGASILVRSGLESTDPAARAAAFRLAADVRDPALTPVLADLLSRSAPDRQIPLLALLRARGDAAALPAVAKAAGSPDAAVRSAAFLALGAVGDATSFPVLLAGATSSDPTEQATAREALEVLRGGDVTAALVAQASAGGVSVEREAFRAIRARSEASAVPALINLCRSDRPATRRLALQTLGGVAGTDDLASIVQLLIEAKDDEARADVQGVFETLVERMGDEAQFNVDPLVRAWAGGSEATRRALLPVVALFVDERLRDVFRTALADSSADMRTVAVRAAGTSRDPALLPALLEAARTASDDRTRSLAFEGYVRMTTDEAVKLTSAERADALAKSLAVATRDEDRKILVKGLGYVPHRLALDAAEKAAAQPAVRAEAEQASLRIAQALGAAEFNRIEGVLNRLGATAGSPTVRSNAQVLLRQLDSGWLVAGPYREAGQQAGALFDVVFPAERAVGAETAWRRAPGSADPARAGEVDLSSVTGGDHCVLYLKTRVWVAAARQVAFAIGSDDGIKLWVSGELVHANNAVRGLTPGQDRAQGRLRDGWNDLLAKITQHTAGCGMTLRITAPDGTEVPGLRIEARGGAAASN